MEERVNENSDIKNDNPEHIKPLKRFWELIGVEKEEQERVINSVIKSYEEGKSDESVT